MERIYRIDNIRILVNMLVILLHIQELLFNTQQMKLLSIVDTFLLVFTMPTIIFFSGALSSEILTREKYCSLIVQILFPYLIFDFIFVLIVKMSSYPMPLHYPFDAALQMWYLLSLIIWRMMLPLFAKFRYSFWLALFLSVGIGYVDNLGGIHNARNDTFSLMRTFVFLPYFILGYNMKNILNNYKKNYFLSILFFILILAVCTGITSLGYQQKLVDLAAGAFSYKSIGLDVSSWICIVYRLAVFSLALLGVYSFQLLVPNVKCFLTSHGQNAMNSYILHAFPLLALTLLHMNTWFAPTIINQVMIFLVSSISAFSFSLLVSSERAVKLLKPVMAPSARWILKH